uniref:Uncharacterized protein n=1 Tax=Anguilla anguilla TaxID=7936 RepID=A0A0E9Q146_ANGAN
MKREEACPSKDKAGIESKRKLLIQQTVLTMLLKWFASVITLPLNCSNIVRNVLC